MHLVSYRGPGVAGGVSTGLHSVFLAKGQQGDCWWYLEENTVKRLAYTADKASPMNVLDERIINGHYRYCNEFLWPVMHDMPQQARYYPADREYYHQFNAALAHIVSSTTSESGDNLSFIQDYQLGLLPLFLKLEAGRRSVVFWHIPWPKTVSRQHVEPLTAIARALLCSDQIGFHTTEYATNFMRFVENNLPNFEVNAEHSFVCARLQTSVGITALEPRRSDERYAGSYVTRPLKTMSMQTSRTATVIRACPLTINMESWAAMGIASDSTAQLSGKLGVKTPFILSVDRADYTKGVKERFRAIDEFVRTHPSQRGKVSFLQVCGRSRPGVRAFDEYWQECQTLVSEINAKWQMADWSPIIWVEQKLSAPELAGLYRNAQSMLITAVRDGLNLTAKEYVACQSGKNSGLLLLSTTTGAWQELQEAAVGIDVSQTTSIVDGIIRSMTMDAHERRLRMDIMHQALKNHTLGDWWQSLTMPTGGRHIETNRQALIKQAAG
jgi:trehalose 6-phosphate synthase/phosphatase